MNQDELAGTMGLTGRYRRRLIERLELGRISRPTLEMVIRYLLACGARWSQFVELMESFTPELPPKAPKGLDSLRFRNYRTVAEVIEQAVGEELKQTDLMPASYAIYKAVARQALGVLWRDTGRRTPGRPPKRTPTRLQDRLEARDARWRRQKLDLTLVKRVRGVVVREFTRLVRKRPELFSTGNRGVR